MNKKKKLKIAMFFSSDPSKAGGVQEHVYYLSRELRRLGHQVDIFGPKAKIVIPFENYFPAGHIFQVPIPNGNWANINISINGEGRIFKIINNDNYDFCHIHEPYIPFLSWQLMKEVRIPKIASFHTAWNDNSAVSFLDSLTPIFKEQFSIYIQGAIFISKIVKKRWQKLCSNKVKTKIIIHGVDHSCFFPVKRKKPGAIELLFLGRLVKRKGLQYLLKSLKKLAEEIDNFKLVIIGDGNERRKFDNYVKRNKLGKKVIFKGEIAGKKRIKYYQKADIFCAPYTDEGFGLTILEAMACGCPIVGFKNRAFKEALGKYPAPELLVKHKDISGLTKALKKAITNEGLRLKLRKWCIKEARKYSWKKNALKTEKFYYEII